MNNFNDKNHFSLIKPLHFLGLVEWRLGNIEKAKNYIKKSFEISGKNNKNLEHIKVGFILNSIGIIKYNLGNYTSAKKYAENSLAIHLSHFADSKHIL